MTSLVLLRWTIPAGRAFGSPRTLIEAVILPAVRTSGWLYSPDTTHFVSDRESEAWVTVVTPVDDATEVRDELADLLTSRPTVESADDVLLSPRAAWYRAALQDVTHVGLDVLETRAPIPLTEHEAFAQPSEGAPRLMPFLSQVSPTYRRSCSTYEATERFWLDFFRWGPVPELSPSGHCLWNLAG